MQPFRVGLADGQLLVQPRLHLDVLTPGAALHHAIHVFVHSPHGEVDAVVRAAPHRITQHFRRQAENRAEQRNRGVVLRANLLQILGRERDLGGVGLLDEQLALRDRLEELFDLLVGGLWQRLHDRRVHRGHPAHEVAHPDRAAAVVDQCPAARARGVEVLHRRAHVRGRAAHRLDTPLDRQTVEVHGIAVELQALLDAGAE